MKSLSSNCTSFVKKSAPIVALYWLLNFLFTYLLEICQGKEHQTPWKQLLFSKAITPNLNEITNANTNYMANPISSCWRILIHQGSLSHPVKKQIKSIIINSRDENSSLNNHPLRVFKLLSSSKLTKTDDRITKSAISIFLIIYLGLQILYKIICGVSS